MKKKDIDQWARFIQFLVILGAVYFILTRVEIIIRPI